MLTLSAILTLLSSQGAASTSELSRVFTANQRLDYSVEAILDEEFRVGGLETWIPQRNSITYKFSMTVDSIGQDGIAQVRYRNPSIKYMEGETFDEGPKTKVDNVNLDFMYRLSPVNDVLEQKDLRPPKTTTPKKKKKGGALFVNLPQQDDDEGGNSIKDYLDGFVADVMQLSLAIGPQGIDLSPRLPFTATKVGEVWKRTIGFQPQRSGQGKKMEVRRMDYTYTNRGTKTVDGKEIIRIDADMSLDTDLGAYFHEASGLKSSQTGLSSWPLSAKLHVEYDLDPKTRTTTKAVLTSSGNYSIILTTSETPYLERKFKGTNTLKLIQIGPKK